MWNIEFNDGIHCDLERQENLNLSSAMTVNCLKVNLNFKKLCGGILICSKDQLIP